MANTTIIGAVTDALRFEMGRDDRVVLLGEDIAKNGGVFRATDGLWAEFGEDRVIDTPLAESGIIGTAVGMAVASDPPNISHAAMVMTGRTRLPPASSE